MFFPIFRDRHRSQHQAQPRHHQGGGKNTTGGSQKCPKPPQNGDKTPLGGQINPWGGQIPPPGPVQGGLAQPGPTSPHFLGLFCPFFPKTTRFRATNTPPTPPANNRNHQNPHFCLFQPSFAQSRAGGRAAKPPHPTEKKGGDPKNGV